jgi:hypothetical protein
MPIMTRCVFGIQDLGALETQLSCPVSDSIFCDDFDLTERFPSGGASDCCVDSCAAREFATIESVLDPDDPMEEGAEGGPRSALGELECWRPALDRPY